MSRIPVVCTVGVPDSEFFPQVYCGKMDDCLSICREMIQKHRRIWTNNARFVCALRALHKIGEIDLLIERSVDGDRQLFALDIKGYPILPWPDEFFEIESHLLFSVA